LTCKNATDHTICQTMARVCPEYINGGRRTMKQNRIKHSPWYGFLNFLYDPLTAPTCRERHLKP
jgi:hypothetical protein